jgi:AMIN domain
MKLTTGILAAAMMTGGAWAQNPNIINNVQNQMTAVQQKQTADSNAALGIQATTPSMPAAKPPAGAPAPAVKPAVIPGAKPAAAKPVTSAEAKPASTPAPKAPSVAASAPRSANKLEHVNVVRHEGDIQIEIGTRESATANVSKLASPDRLVLELPATAVATDQDKISVGTAGVKGVRIGMNGKTPPTTSVVVDLERALPYDLSPGPSTKFVLTLHTQGATQVATKQTTGTQVAAKSSATPVPAKASTAAAKPPVAAPAAAPKPALVAIAVPAPKVANASKVQPPAQASKAVNAGAPKTAVVAVPAAAPKTATVAKVQTPPQAANSAVSKTATAGPAKVTIAASNPPAKAASAAAPAKSAADDKLAPIGATADAAKTPKPEDKKWAMTGKHDPFVSPVMQESSGSGCSTGKKCLEIGQINVRGVVKSQDGYIAVVTNSMNKAYFLHENDPVFNGFVMRITGDSVVFQETYQDKLGKPVTREVTKRVTTPAV